MDSDRSIQNEVLRSLLRPLVRFCLARSHSIQDFTNMAKVVFVAVAEEEILKSTRKINVSRISAMTGMYREDVHRIFRDKELPTDEPLSVLGRVIGQWRHDKRFTTKAGQPRVLSFKGEESDFHALCYSISKNLNAGTILFELTRMGYAEKTAHGAKLLRQMIGIDGDPRPGFELLAKDIESLLQAVEENLLEKSVIPNLHIRTEYDNITPKALPKIRRWLIDEGKNFHKRCRKFISKFDKDLNANLNKEEGGAKVVVGSFAQSLKTPSSQGFTK